MITRNFSRRASFIAVLAAFNLSAAHADERVDMEQLKATTLELIDTLVENGVLTREKADKLIANAEARAKAHVVETAPTLKLADSMPAPELGKDGKKIVRVPYVPESMKREIRDQIKQEVLAQAKEERWGNPATLPEWADRIQIEGDVRLRFETTLLDRSNTPAGTAKRKKTCINPGNPARNVSAGIRGPPGRCNPNSRTPLADSVTAFTTASTSTASAFHGIGCRSSVSPAFSKL